MVHISPNLLWSGSITCTSSTSTLRKMSWSYFLLSSVKIGAMSRQGPHQVAVKSTTIWDTEKTEQKIMLQPLTLAGRHTNLKRIYLIWGIARDTYNFVGNLGFRQLCVPSCLVVDDVHVVPHLEVSCTTKTHESQISYMHEQKSNRTDRRCQSLVRKHLEVFTEFKAHSLALAPNKIELRAPSIICTWGFCWRKNLWILRPHVRKNKSTQHLTQTQQKNKEYTFWNQRSVAFQVAFQNCHYKSKTSRKTEAHSTMYEAKHPSTQHFRYFQKQKFL